MVTGQENMTKKTNSINILSHKILSVQASLNGLSFSILNTSDQNIELLEQIKFDGAKNPIEVEAALKESFHNNTALQQEFKSVNLIHDNDICTFVPKSLFDESQLTSYLKFTSKLFDSDFIAHDEITAKEIVAVYIPFVNLNNYFFELFGSFEYHHASEILMKQLLHQATGLTTKMYCNINATSFELIYIKNGALYFFNSFQYTNEEDFLYYILFTFEQLQLDTETLDFIFLGDIGLEDTIYEYTYNYVRNVSFGSRATQFMFRDLNHKPKYGYDHFTLLNSF